LHGYIRAEWEKVMNSFGRLNNPSNAMHRFPGRSKRFFHQKSEIRVTSRTTSNSVRVTIGPFTIGGNDPIYDLPLIELKRDGKVHLTFPEGAMPTMGEVYRIVRPSGFYDEEFSFPGRLRKTVAKVRILSVSCGNRAEVQVLRGSVLGGMSAEKD
jgi:hypothetical protein